MATHYAAFSAFLLPSLLQAQGWETRANLLVDLTFPVVVELNGNIHVMGGGGPGGASNVHVEAAAATMTSTSTTPSGSRETLPRHRMWISTGPR